MRADLQAWADAANAASGAVAEAAAGEAVAEVTARPRCVVFAADEEAAAGVSAALRTSLWGDH
eukprot:3053909-Prymnesium_polylepis.1